MEKICRECNRYFEEMMWSLVGFDMVSVEED